MTSQIPDSVIWKKKKYELLGFNGDEEESLLFNPVEYGFSPMMMHTACYRGYYCTYKIVRNSLYLDQLCINDGHNGYPLINEVEAGPDNGDGRVYEKIDLPILYTGVLRIGADFKSEYYIHMGFQKPSAYGIVWDLTITDGKVTDRIDISAQVSEIEGRYHTEYRNRDFIDQIDDPFKRDLQLR